MRTFLIVFLMIYTGMHAVVFVAFRGLLSGRWILHGFCMLFFAVMIVAPICARLLERGGHESSALLTAWIGYPWMGFIFLCFCALCLLGLLNLSVRLLNSFAGANVQVFDGKIAILAVLGFVLLLSAYGYLEAKFVRVERVQIVTSKLPAGMDRLKIAQISDVHLGLMVRDERLRSILEKVRSENPDILVCTGDLVDGSFGRVNHIPEIFGIIQPRYGKYAVTGNHEVYAGLSYSLKSIELFGFRILRGEATTIGDILNVVGVDDPAVGSQLKEIDLLSSAKNGLFTLFLKHRPSVPEGSQGLYDLQLSGHTHRGQIFPFCLITRMFYPRQNGLYELKRGSKLYTSRGSGTWGPPMRILSPPEVTIIELRRETGADDVGVPHAGP